MPPTRVLAAIAVVLTAGCAGGGAPGATGVVPTRGARPPATIITAPLAGSGAPSTTPVASSPVESITTAPLDAPQPEESPVPSLVAVTDPPATIPVAGDPFCDDYRTIVVSTYLFGLVEAFDADPLAARRLEVIAAAPLEAAARAALAELPPAAAGEAGAFARRWSGYTQRAAAALAALGPAADTAELSSAWLAVLTEQDLNEPHVVVPLPADVAAALDAVVGAYAAQVGPIADDPLVAAASAVPTEAVDDHAAAHCPDVAVLAAGDAV